MSTLLANDGVKIESILRSINVIYDADKPDRIAHFYPTSKANVLIEALLGYADEKDYLISAPYGSGKSLTATYVLHAVENTALSKDVLKKIGKKIRSTNQVLGDKLLSRANSTNKGIAIALQGYSENVSFSLKKGLEESLARLGYEPFDITFGFDFSNIESSLISLKQIYENLKKNGIDRFVLLWDEFGRHIETLLSEGGASRLNEIQTIAEYASRFTDVPFTLGLILHQSLLNYAGKSPQSVKKEWKKIEGRFQTIQYIDDSKEIYKLIAKVINELSPEQDFFEEEYVKKAIKEVKRAKIFTDFSDQELQDLFYSAFPVYPIALYLLPRISSRVAQHERTLFTFLNTLTFQGFINVDDLFDYFSAAMSGDTTIGGTYHQWLEAKSALTKSDSETETRIIKTASLLGIGMSGERARVSREYLAVASQGYDLEAKSVEAAIQELIEKKLLLYRKNSNSVSIWHGTDIDLSGRLEEEKNRQYQQFDLIDFLMKVIEPVNWKPIEYNNDFSIQRYFNGEYLDLKNLRNLLQDDLSDGDRKAKLINTGEDGKIYYVLPANENEKDEAVKLIKKKGNFDQVVWALPRGNVDIFETALEVHCYHVLQSDAALIESDPLILPELQQLTDDATEYLQKLVDIAVNPSLKGPVFIYRGREVQKTSARELRHFLSLKMRRIFKYTPVFNNEMINRKKPRKTLINARKKLIFAVLDQTGKKNLSLEGHTPDVSMFRTLLLNTGLYKEHEDNEGNSVWRFSQPEEIEDEGLSNVWHIMKDFFTEPKENETFQNFFSVLTSPPYGMRLGVIPIMFAASLRAFPSSLSIKTRRGEYLDDILPSTIEDICAKPEEYMINVHELSEPRLNFLKEIYSIFAGGNIVSVREKDIMRRCYDAVEYWKSTLPDSAFTTRQVSPAAQKVQDSFIKEGDPERLFFYKWPSIFDTIDIDTLEKNIRAVKKEIEGVIDIYYIHASKTFLSAIQFESNDEKNLLVAANRWASFFPDSAYESMADDTAKAFLKRVKMKYTSRRKMIDSIAALLIGRPLNRWDDSAIMVFDRSVKEVVKQIEEHMLHNADDTQDESIKEGLVSLAQERIRFLYKRLIDITGEDEAHLIIDKLRKEVS